MKPLLILLIGLIIGFGVMWWIANKVPRHLAQSSDRIATWATVTSAEEASVNNGTTTWVVGSQLRLKNISNSPVNLTVPAQRFLVTFDDGSTVVGVLPAAATAHLASQQAAVIELPKITFCSRSMNAGSVLVAVDEGDGLRILAAPVGSEPKAQTEPKPEPKPEPAAKPAASRPATDDPLR